MEKNEIGRFFGTTFHGKIYEFIVYDDHTICCPTMNVNNAKRIILKPRFRLLTDENIYPIHAEAGNTKQLIKSYNISEELLEYLKNEGMIWYSTDMAYLYDFKDKDGFDKKWQNGTSFKHARKKGNILEKWKKGEFN